MEKITMETTLREQETFVETNENESTVYNREAVWREAYKQARDFLLKIPDNLNFSERVRIIKSEMNRLAEQGNENRFVVEVLARTLALEESEQTYQQALSNYQLKV